MLRVSNVLSPLMWTLPFGLVRRIDAKNTMVASYEEVLRAQIDAHQMEDDDKSFDCEGPYAESDDEVEEEAEQ